MSFCLKQEQISLNEARKMNLIQRENKILFLTQLPDIFSCFKQKLNFGNFFQKTKQIILLLKYPYYM